MQDTSTLSASGGHRTSRGPRWPGESGRYKGSVHTTTTPPNTQHPSRHTEKPGLQQSTRKPACAQATQAARGAARCAQGERQVAGIAATEAWPVQLSTQQHGRPHPRSAPCCCCDATSSTSSRQASQHACNKAQAGPTNHSMRQKPMPPPTPASSPCVTTDHRQDRITHGLLRARERRVASHRPTAAHVHSPSRRTTGARAGLTPCGPQ